jgi:hypothetical protein
LAYDGSGDQVVEITKSRPGPAIVVLAHGGTGRFVVRGLDDERKPTDSLVDAAGPYTRPLDLASGSTKFLDITADGAWHIEVEGLAMARHVDAETTGHGDDVVFYAGQGGRARWTHDGNARFVVHTYTGSGGNDLIDARGAYDDTVTMDGPGYIEIVADGSWTVAVR